MKKEDGCCRGNSYPHELPRQHFSSPSKGRGKQARGIPLLTIAINAPRISTPKEERRKRKEIKKDI